MIASGAGGPVGGGGSGAYGTIRGRDRSGDAADPATGGVRPVAPTDGAGERAWRRPDGRSDSAPAQTGQRPADALPTPQDSHGGGALVPVGRPGVPARGAAAAAAGVPVASAPTLSAPIAPATALLVQVAAARAGDAGGIIAGGAVPAWTVAPDDDGPAVAPPEAAAASDAYRQRGGLPPLRIEIGRILRASV